MVNQSKMPLRRGEHAINKTHSKSNGSKCYGKIVSVEKTDMSGGWGWDGLFNR